MVLYPPGQSQDTVPPGETPEAKRPRAPDPGWKLRTPALGAGPARLPGYWIFAGTVAGTCSEEESSGNFVSTAWAEGGQPLALRPPRFGGRTGRGSAVCTSGPCGALGATGVCAVRLRFHGHRRQWACSGAWGWLSVPMAVPSEPRCSRQNEDLTRRPLSVLGEVVPSAGP